MTTVFCNGPYTIE